MAADSAHISRHSQARRCALELIAEDDARVATGLYSPLPAEIRARMSNMCVIAWLDGSCLTLERMVREISADPKSTGDA